MDAESPEQSSAAFVDYRPVSVAQRLQQQGIDGSPRQVMQRERLEHVFGEHVRRQGEPEVDELQAQWAPSATQRQSRENNEPRQCRGEPAQHHGGTHQQDLLQGKPSSVHRRDTEDEDPLQGEFVMIETPTHRGPEENFTGMPDSLKAGIESLSGLAMSKVNVHYNSPKPAQLNALAYTQGTDIHLGPRQEQHLAHEAWHVVQQIQGRVKPTFQSRGVSINDDQGLEREADVMGAKALQGRWRAGRTSRASGASAGTGIVQRRIGFEIETGIPITERVANPHPGWAMVAPMIHRDAHPQTMAQTVRQGSLVISADHTVAHNPKPSEPFNHWSIIEAVTDPIDDSMGINQFDAQATVWLARLIAHKQAARATPPAHQLLGTNYYLGLPSAQPYGDWDRIAPQVTVGVPLDQVGNLISRFPLSGTASAFNATQLAKAAPAKALAVMQQLIGAIPPGAQHGVPQLRGLVTLMMNYLTAGNDDQIAKVIYMKNRPANVFYKSKLSDVRDNLLNFGYGARILGTVPGRFALRLLLLAQSGRTAGDPLFKADPDPVNPQGVASAVTVGTWITEVLDGTDDRIFDEMKNPWANEIAPDANDEVVIELRKRAFDLTHSDFTLEDFNGGLLEYMRKVYLANKAVKLHEV